MQTVDVIMAYSNCDPCLGAPIVIAKDAVNDKLSIKRIL